MNISISKQEIFNEVEKRTSLEGYIASENYDKILAGQDRGELLDSYWIEACTAVIQLMKRYLTHQTVSHEINKYNTDEVFTITASMPARYNSLLDGNVTTDIKMLIACNILSRWFSVVSPGVSAKYTEESQGYAEDLKVKLLYRSEPTAELSSAIADRDKVSLEEEANYKTSSDDSSLKVEEEALGVIKIDEEPLVQKWDPCKFRHL